jgi:hypothetical protein
MPLQRVIQLVHLSDVHFGPEQPGSAAIARGMLEGASERLGRLIVDAVKQGLCGHAPYALHQLVKSILTNATGTDWRPTRVLMTGDLSTWGDDASIKSTLRLLREIAGDTGDPFVIYGNHDVWPGRPWQRNGFPLFATDDELNQRRTRLRKDAAYPFTGDWPLGPFERITMPSGRTLALYSLNTIMHDSLPNALAAGHVRSDRYWEGSALADQLIEFERRAREHADVSLMLTHHPAHDPVPWPQGESPGVLSHVVAPVWHALRNSDAVGEMLGARHPTTGLPFAHVVLSGHTHEVFPPFGKLPEVPPTGEGRHGLLKDQQVQMTVGTASQMGLGKKAHEQCWQLLRIYEETDPPQLIIERSVFARTGRTSEYKPKGEKDKNCERLTIDLARAN